MITEFRFSFGVEGAWCAKFLGAQRRGTPLRFFKPLQNCRGLFFFYRTSSPCRPYSLVTFFILSSPFHRGSPPSKEFFPHLHRWFAHIFSFGQEGRQGFPGSAGVAAEALPLVINAIDEVTGLKGVGVKEKKGKEAKESAPAAAAATPLSGAANA